MNRKCTALMGLSLCLTACGYSNQEENHRLLYFC